MLAADYIAQFLARHGVTDAFGIPGGPILELLYAMERTQGITPRLCYHEQGAAFAAAGFGQCGGAPGVVFATCGPGVLNTVTPVADACCDSTALLVLTGHGHPRTPAAAGTLVREQGFDPGPVFSAIAKAFVCIDTLQQVHSGLCAAWAAATGGRRGPVVVDILSGLLTQELPVPLPAPAAPAPALPDTGAMAADIQRRIAAAKRPVLLLGEGVKLAGTEQLAAAFAAKNQIPVLCSRYAQDIMPGAPLYFGYIGSHGMRAANFILSKADLIVALGNRLAFPARSASFRPLVENTAVLRVDIDTGDPAHSIPGAVEYRADLADVMPALLAQPPAAGERGPWLAVCARLRKALAGCDICEPVELIAALLRGAGPGVTVTSDVGSSEMWLSRAYELAGTGSRVLYSKAFGALGCSLPKAVGACLAAKRPVLCCTGDQGLQMNVQELQTVAAGGLPILIAVLNNRSSGMIREHEQARGAHPLLTTPETGYAPPPLEKLAAAYGIPYYRWPDLTAAQRVALLGDITAPALLEVPFGAEHNVTPQLKRGDPCQKLFPYLAEELYQELDAL